MKKKKYRLNSGLTVLAPTKSCLFCVHCSDVFYDYHGIYNTICMKDKNIIKGSQGKCCFFKHNQ